jgi:ASC-1-like (ASCH) protein
MIFRVQDKYFQMIKDGSKNVEGRINNNKYSVLNKGDIIKFSANENNKTIECRVVGIKKYETFKEMLSKEGIENMLPGIKNIEEAFVYTNRLEITEIKLNNKVVLR